MLTEGQHLRMSNQIEESLSKQSNTDNIDQWSEALLVYPEVSAEIVWPTVCPAHDSHALYQNSHVCIQVRTLTIA